MAEQIVAPSEAYNPWASNEWDNVDTYVVSQEASQEPSNATPWASDWGTGTSYLGNGVMPRSASFGSRGPDNSSDGKFDRVFRNLIQQESRGQHTDRSGQLTTSPVGAQGITQVMPKTGKNPGYGIQPLQNDSEEEYIRFGKDYLNAMLTEFNGNYEQALAAYNAGAGNVKKAVERGGAQWKDFLPKKQETIPYIRNIMRGIGQDSSVLLSGSDKPAQGRAFYESLPATTMRERGGKLKGREISETAMMRTADTPITDVYGGGNTSGWVYADNPDRIFLAAPNENTLLHEREHLSQSWADKNMQDQSRALYAVGNYSRPVNQFIREIVKMKGDPVINKVFSASNAFDSPAESLANYAAYFQQTNEDPFKSDLYKVLEKKFGEEKAREYITAANAYTMMDTPSFTSVDYTPENPVVKDFKGKNDSYAIAAYQYLKSIFGD